MVKEYKALLQAQEFNDEVGFINTARSILTDCTFNAIDVDELPIYVIDYLFLMIRAKSVGEVIEAEYKCNWRVPTEEAPTTLEPCGFTFKVSFSLLDCFVKYPADFNKKCIIQLSDSVGMRLKSPTFSKFRSVGLEGKDLFDITDEYVFACVDCIFDGDKVLYPITDFNLKDLQEFIEQFPANKIDQITQFFREQPSVCLTMNVTCPKCKNTSVVELNGVQDFFD